VVALGPLGGSRGGGDEGEENGGSAHAGLGWVRWESTYIVLINAGTTETHRWSISRLRETASCSRWKGWTSCGRSGAASRFRSRTSKARAWTKTPRRDGGTE